MISVIIPTLNRSKLLAKTLLSLTQQTVSLQDFEILVVDNGSTDDTQQVVGHFRSTLPKLKYILEKDPGLHAGRHRGMHESSGDILVFADDDIVAFPTWLEGIVESFQDDRTGLVGGKNVPDYESPPPDWVESLWVKTPEGRYMTYFSLLSFGEEVIKIDPHFVFGCNFSIRKPLLLQIRGFHPDGMPSSLLKYRGDGETHVANEVHRLGYNTIYNPKASVKHWVPSSRMNLDYIKKRAFSEGITHSYIDTRKEKQDHNRPGYLVRKIKALKEIFLWLFSTELDRAIKMSHQAGYAFHQAELKRDKDLRPWVMKEDYIS